MKNAIATLIALVVTAYILTAFIGPGDDLSTGQWVLAMIIGIPVFLGIMLLFNGSGSSK